MPRADGDISTTDVPAKVLKILSAKVDQIASGDAAAVDDIAGDSKINRRTREETAATVEVARLHPYIHLRGKHALRGAVRQGHGLRYQPDDV